MQKIGLYLILVGALIAIGLFLSQYSSQIIVEDLTTNEADILPGGSLEVIADLNPRTNKEGVYFVQSINFKERTISAEVIDPAGNLIISKNIDVEKFEEVFNIDSAGTYRLIIENYGPEETHIIGVIGHMPDVTKISIRNASFAFLIVGMVGMVGMGIFAIRSRAKRKSS